MPNLAYRWGPTTSLNVTSGTAVTSVVLASQTRTVRVVSAAASCNVLVTDAAVLSTAIDTGGAYLPPAVPDYLIVGPGQRLNVHSQTVTSTVLWVTETI